MRKACLEMVHELAKADERVMFIGSDLGAGSLDAMRAEMPGRFLMEGISEQALLGMAAGLAMEGRVVYLNTIGVFLARRAFEQIYLDLCLHKAKVRLIGSGGGLVYSPLGPTHMAVEDLSSLRSLPGLSILAPCDAQQMRALMPQTLDQDGPVYIRLAKGGDRVVSTLAAPAQYGKASMLREGGEVLFVTTGIAARIALDAADMLAGGGVSATVLHCHTVKPLDREAILDAASRARAVVSIEEGVLSGGLGGAVAELLAEAQFIPPALHRMGLPDEPSGHYGSQDELLEHFGLTPARAAEAARALLSGPRARRS
ncbi:transketolase family protein [Fundidesulfovibrio putealis]|uniref:transketolase family protein n=1 Tax=Fundidesulfovibrio putealis TaxID=270496 RepID=UPI0004217928|nr:transketolase C-terminal domain-containing protein [Fundidesulfovibrio putealis]